MLSFRKYVVLAVVTLFAALGDVCLKRGMSAVGEISVGNLGEAVRAIAHPWVFVGIALLLIFFAAYLHALSWADLTFVLPAAATSYVVLALLSRFWLGEQVGVRRWVGIFLIVAAVGFVTRGHHVTTPAPAPEPGAELAALPVGAED